MKRKLERYLLPTAACLSLAAGGCSDDGAGTGSGGRAHLSVSQQALSAADISKVTVTVSGTGITPNIVQDMTLTGGTWSGLIQDITPGPNRTFLGDAFNLGNTKIYTGSAPGVTIQDDVTTQVTIFLQQVAAPTPFANAVPRFTSLVLSQNPVIPGGVVSLVAAATDPNSEVLTYAWTASGGMFSSTSTPSTNWTAPLTEGFYNLTITATDPKGSAAVLTAALEVASPPAGDAQVTIDINTSPEVSGLTASPTRLDAGQSTALNLTATDPDGDTLSYAWTSSCTGTFNNPSTQDPTFTLTTVPVGNADCTLSVTITDGSGGSNTASLAIATGPLVCSGTSCGDAPGQLVWTGNLTTTTAYGAAALTNGRVAAVGDQAGVGRARLFDSNGMMIWDQAAQGPQRTYRGAAADMTAQRVFALTHENTGRVGITALDATTGTQMWFQQGSAIGTTVTGSAITAGDDGRPVFAYQIDTTQAQLSKLDAVTGFPLFNVGLPLSQGVPRFLATRTNSIYLERHNTTAPVTNWNVQAFEANVGSSQWTATIATMPNAEPIGLAVNGMGEIVLHIARTTDNALFETRISPSGLAGVTTQIATLTSRPVRTRLSPTGNIYVAQSGGGDSAITKLSSTGTFMYTTEVSNGTAILRDLVLASANVCVVGNDAMATGFVACFEN